MVEVLQETVNIAMEVSMVATGVILGFVPIVMLMFGIFAVVQFAWNKYEDWRYNRDRK